MTTEARSPRSPGRHATSGMLLRSALGSAAAIGLVAVLGAVVTGRDGALGALVGGAIVLVVFWAGTAALEAMSSRSADLALMMALVTYSGQVIVVLAAFIGLSVTGALDGTLSRGWLAIAVVVGSLVWSAAQVRLAAASRMPAYDLPEQQPSARSEEAGA